MMTTTTSGERRVDDAACAVVADPPVPGFIAGNPGAGTAGCAAYLRGAPPGLPFRWDSPTVQRGLNFTLVTQLGDIDLLGEIVGGGGYDALLTSATVVRVFGIECHCLNLDRLIEVKRAAGRPKDFEAIAELETIRDQRQRGDAPS